MSIKETHLAGLHPGRAHECMVTCKFCQHACASHVFGTKCTINDCGCKSYGRIASTEEIASQMVSCMMVTKASRMHMVRRAIQCFKDQTYPWKELVIISDDDLSELNHSYIWVPQGLRLGDLRNIAIARSSGAYVAQWDDDDWYHPERLACQIKLLKDHPDADGVTLARWLLAWPAKDHYAVSMKRDTGWEGSILARRWQIPVYPGIPRGEDASIIKNMKLVVMDDPHLYIYVVHGANTWDQPHFESMFQMTSRRLSSFEVELIKKCLELPEEIPILVNGETSQPQTT